MPTRSTAKKRVSKRPVTRRAQQRIAQQTIEYAFVTCRTLRHAWDPIGAGDRRPQFGTLVCLRCERCGTLRYDKFSRLTGERISAASYVYPAGYRESGKKSMAWYRAAWADSLDAKVLVEADEQDSAL